MCSVITFFEQTPARPYTAGFEVVRSYFLRVSTLAYTRPIRESTSATNARHSRKSAEFQTSNVVEFTHFRHLENSPKEGAEVGGEADFRELPYPQFVV